MIIGEIFVISHYQKLEDEKESLKNGRKKNRFVRYGYIGIDYIYGGDYRDEDQSGNGFFGSF